MLEHYSGHTEQWVLELVGDTTLLHQQLTAFSAVGTLLNIFPGANVIVTGTLGTRIHIVGEVLADFHHAVDKVQGQGFTGEFSLIRVGLDVCNGTSMHLIAIAFIGTMVALENNI